MTPEKINLVHLVGNPLPGDAVLRYDLTKNTFYVHPEGFDKYGIRAVPRWRWVNDRWELPARPTTITILAGKFPGVLTVHKSAMEKVVELLGYDPCSTMVRGRFPLSRVAGEVVLTDTEVKLEELEVVQARDSSEDDEDDDEHYAVEASDSSKDGDERFREALARQEEVLATLPQVMDVLRNTNQVMRDFTSILASIDNRVGTIEAQVNSLQIPYSNEAAETMLRALSDSEAAEKLISTINEFERLSAPTQLILKEMCRQRELFEYYRMKDWTPLLNSCDRALENTANTKLLEPLVRVVHSSFQTEHFREQRFAWYLGLSGQRNRTFFALRNLLKAATGQDRSVEPEDRSILERIFEAAFPERLTDLESLSQEIEQHWYA